MRRPARLNREADMKYAYLVLIVLTAALTTSCASLKEKMGVSESAPAAKAAPDKENARKDEARKEEAKKKEEARKKEQARKEEAAQKEEARKKAEAEGKVVGKPAHGSKFAKLKLGMSLVEVEKLIGPPTKQWTHPTGKAAIPFYFGPDRWVIQCAYKHEGVLTFNSGGDQVLTLIEVNKAE
jgi:hypothetical protein